MCCSSSGPLHPAIFDESSSILVMSFTSVNEELCSTNINCLDTCFWLSLLSLTKINEMVIQVESKISITLLLTRQLQETYGLTAVLCNSLGSTGFGKFIPC